MNPIGEAYHKAVDSITPKGAIEHDQGSNDHSREDPQKLKKIAAAAYDYENDPGWPTTGPTSSSLLTWPPAATPSPISSKSSTSASLLDPDLLVDTMSSSSSSQPQRPPASSRSTNDSAGTSATSPPTSLRWDRQTIQFSINAWVFLVAVLATFPFVPKQLSHRAYRLSFMGMASSSLYSLYSFYGIKIYFDQLNFFVSSHLCFKFALIPILCWALVHVALIPVIMMKYLEESNTTTLSILSSHAEIGIGFLLIISLFSWQRNIVQTFVYWQLLKLMYHASVTSDYHVSVWTIIGRTAHPFIRLYAPFLETPLLS
ncbi:hypothetical protein M0R45_033157 [Rubus argutus]|uniref:Transmembrane protein n=1 Tax=Rubus argutus TaxID=59490 RepID=A0AAW1WKD2_RUBAR